MLLAKPNINKEFKDLKIISLADNDLPFQTLIEEFAINGAVIWIDELPAYLDELRADYINKEIYIPVYKEDKVERVTYNCRLEKYILHTYKNGYNADYIIIQPNVISEVAFKINLKDRKLCRELTEYDKKAVSLFDRYIAYSYGYTKYEQDVFKYKAVKKSNLTSYERKVLKDLGLEYYGEYLDTEYRDVRQWKFEVLVKRFNSGRLQLEKPFEVRRLNFELELYTRIYSNQLWKEWTLGNFDELLNDKRQFLKYKEKDIYLIFKKKWFTY